MQQREAGTLVIPGGEGLEGLVGNRSSKEKRNERESSGRNSLGIVNFRCNVISIRVFRMNYWPVPLIPSGGYIWYSLLQPTIRSILSSVRCIPQEAALYPAYFIPPRCSLLLQLRAFVREIRKTTRNRRKSHRLIILRDGTKNFSSFVPPIGICYSG